MDRNFILLRKNIPTSKTIRLVHARKDAPRQFALARPIKPRHRRKCLVFLEVAELTQINARPLTNQRRRPTFPIRFPRKPFRQSEFLWLTHDDAFRHHSHPFVQGNLQKERFRLPQLLHCFHGDCLLPSLQLRRRGLLSLLNLPANHRHFFGNRLHADRILTHRHRQGRSAISGISIAMTLAGVPKKRRHRIEILLGDRIKLVIVTHRTIRSQPQPDPGSCLHSIPRIVRQIFLGNRSPLRRSNITPVKTRRHQLLASRLRQKIAPDLLHRKIIEMLITIKRFNHPFPIRPHLPVIIEMQSIGVPIPSRIQPVARTMLTVTR